MGLTRWAESKIQKFTIWDFGLLKFALVLFGVIIGAYIADFVKVYVIYLGIAFLIMYVILAYRMLKL